MEPHPILATLVGSSSASLFFLYMFRRSDPAKFRFYVRLFVGMNLTLVLTKVAEIKFSVTSILESIAIGVVISVVVTSIVFFLSGWKKGNFD